MQNYLKSAEILANILDNQFEFFGMKFGFAAILDLIPEFGDLLAAALSLYLVWIALQMRIPLLRVLQMLGNIALNLLIGLIPIIGDIGYITNKANMKNLKILKEYSYKIHPLSSGSRFALR